MINFRQGEDRIIPIPVYDNKGQAVDLSGADKIRVGFIIKKDIAQKFLDDSLEPIISGYGICYYQIDHTNILEVYVTREISRCLPIGKLSARILVEFPDTLLTGEAIEYESEIGYVLEGYLKDEDLSL